MAHKLFISVFFVLALCFMETTAMTTTPMMSDEDSKCPEMDEIDVECDEDIVKVEGFNHTYCDNDPDVCEEDEVCCASPCDDSSMVCLPLPKKRDRNLLVVIIISVVVGLFVCISLSIWCGRCCCEDACCAQGGCQCATREPEVEIPGPYKCPTTVFVSTCAQPTGQPSCQTTSHQIAYPKVFA